MQRRRRGAALIELAICLPLIVFLIGATIEVCDLIFLRNSLTASVYSGTLEISRLGSTEASVRDKIEQSLAGSGVENATITITAADDSAFDSVVQGENGKLVVSATVADNLRLSGFLQLKNRIVVRGQAVR